MVQSEDLGILVFVIAIACAAKILPTLIMGKILTRRTWRYCLTLGILMNTRGLVELIVLNIGLESGILSVKLYVSCRVVSCRVVSCHVVSRCVAGSCSWSACFGRES